VLFFCKDSKISDELTLALRMRWPATKPLVATSDTVGVTMAYDQQPDLIIICQTNQDLSVWDYIEKVRRFSDIPIVVAATDGDSTETVRALEMGADDYIALPCNLLVFVAKMIAIVRRYGRAVGMEQESIRCGSLTIDPRAHEAFVESTPLKLTPTEFRLLCLFAKNRSVTLTREAIVRAMWADEYEFGRLKKYVQRLRNKLEEASHSASWIKTIHGVGYCFAPSEASQATPVA
ncbi:MAG: response regulator transcription factor, partial [Chloroflexi bacterium]|nr:response regulator transcription factor [Chloroflexota bacterium]